MNFIKKLEASRAVYGIRNGLIKILPIILTGAFTLVLMFFPIPAYQTFIQNLFNGVFYSFLGFMNNVTLGLFSVYMVISISTAYTQFWELKMPHTFGGVIVSLSCFGILIGFGSPSFSVSYLGVKGMFAALIGSLAGSSLFIFFKQRLPERHNQYADGTDFSFNNSISIIWPTILAIVIFALINLIFVTLFNVSGIQEFFINICSALFDHIRNEFLRGLLFILVSSILWFFGIHGSNILEGVVEKFFIPVIFENAAASISGSTATSIVSKTFIDVFVLMGGCGTTLCLLISLFIFSKRRCNRSLSKLAIIPMLFNINEIMVFGLPIIFNTYFLIPFILTPLACYIISYCATLWHLVPVAVSEVNWTTPVLLGGYATTHSVAGALLQLFNLVTGVFIYMPFIKMYDRAMEKKSQKYLDELIQIYKDSEISTIPVRLTELRSELGALAKTLALDLKQSIGNQDFKIFYQPQFDNHNNCIGVEALLRWKHPVYGMIYPPLVIKLAQEINMLPDFERMIIEKVFTEAPHIHHAIKHHCKISANVTVETLRSEGFEAFLQEVMDVYGSSDYDLCIEITEQMALKADDDIEQLMVRIRQMGYKLAIDDFSMGHTSLKYLQSSQFDIVKLDGALVRNLNTNTRSKDIVKSIVYLSKSLGFSILAEYVETREIQALLEEIGCLQYQGYLYGAAVPLEYFTATMYGKS